MHLKAASGSSAGGARLVRDEEAVGSNPTCPTLGSADTVMRTISALPCYFHKPSAYWKIANSKVTIDKSAFGFINVFLLPSWDLNRRSAERERGKPPRMAAPATEAARRKVRDEPFGEKSHLPDFRKRRIFYVLRLSYIGITRPSQG